MFAVRQFEFLERLGSGSSGEVYRAVMSGASGDVQTPVAVKMLKEDLKDVARWGQRLRDEARMLAALDHPNIVRVIDLVELAEHKALVTEYVEGGDLTTLIRGRTPLPLRPLCMALSQAADALHGAYVGTGPLSDQPLHLVHRDVKPSNIRVSRHGHVKLLDFGIAIGDMDRNANTDSGTVVGSLAYMAPERFDGLAGPESDVFALGAVLFESLAGEPFQLECTSAELVMRMAVDDRFVTYMDERMKLLEKSNWNATDLVVKMLAFTASERPTAAEVARRLEEIADHEEGPSLRSWCRDRKWPIESAKGRFSGVTMAEPRPPANTPEPPPERPQIQDRLWPGLVLGLLTGVLIMGIVGVGLGMAGVLAWSIS